MLIPGTVKQFVTGLALLGLSMSAVLAQMPVPSAGAVPDVPGATDVPDPSRSYKFAFDVQSMPSSSDSVSPALISIARLLNTYRARGVSADHFEATAIFHGPTIVLVTRDETYRNRTGARGNPNLSILRELAAAGVKLVVCGVSAREQNYTSSDLVPSAHLNLSATVTLMELQSRGYVKVER